MKSFLCFLATCSCFFRAGAEEVPVTVLGDRVNLRNGTGLQSEVVGQANYGDTLRAVSFTPEWVEVRPPEGFTTWVYADHLFEDSEVRIPVLNVRVGPSTDHSIVGKLERGDRVEVLQSLEEWRRVAPPESVTLWISRRFVQAPPSAEITETGADSAPTATPEAAVAVMPGPEGTDLELSDPTPTPAPTATPTPEPTPEPVVEVREVETLVEAPVVPTPTPTAVPPEDLKLVPLEGQGTLSVRRGRVKAFLLAGTSPSRFMLLEAGEGDGGKTLAYLRGDEEEIKHFVGRTVTVRGRDFWVTGQRLPVTEVTSIQPVGGGE